MKWQVVKFSDLFRVKHGYAFKSHYFDSEGPYVLLTPGSFYEEGGYRDQGEKTKFYTAEVPEGFILDEGDLIVAMTEQAPGLLGSSAWIPGSNRFLHNQRLGRIVELDESRLNKRYLYYLFNTREIRHQISGSATGTKVRHTAPERIGRVTVNIPPITVQRRIADILSAYDDLIENNRRRMALLEEAGRQLYRDWFVRLRFPGHKHTRITNGVPDGWEWKPIAALTLFLKRGITPHYDEDAEGLVINQKCIRNSRLDVTLARRQSREFKPDQQVQRGDVLVNSTGQGTLGRVAQVLAAIPNCTVDTHVTIVRPRQTAGSHYFGLAVMDWEPRFSTMGRGATNQTELSPGQIGAAEVLLPSHSLIQQFEEYASPIFNQVVTLTDQNNKLRAARDLLLPRLLSGEIAL